MSEKTTERRRDFDGPVSHDRAREAAQRFIDLAFNNKKSERPQLRIPADPNDDDLVLTSYIAQQRALTSERDEAVRAREAYREALVLVRHLTAPDGMSLAYLGTNAGEDIADLHEMVSGILDSFTTTGGLEPQKGITE